MSEITTFHWAEIQSHALLVRGKPSIGQMEQYAEAMEGVEESKRWWMGDLLIEAYAEYGDDAFQIIPEGKESSWMNSYRVARAWPIEERWETLSWSHHDKTYPDDEGLRAAWMQLAEDEGWSAHRLYSERRGEIKSNNWKEKYELLRDICIQAVREYENSGDGFRLVERIRGGLDE